MRYIVTVAALIVTPNHLLRYLPREFMAFCELGLKASLHPGMNERRGWFDHDRDLIVVLVAEPIERHGPNPIGARQSICSKYSLERRG
jgi:hypothetical protein